VVPEGAGVPAPPGRVPGRGRGRIRERRVGVGRRAEGQRRVRAGLGARWTFLSDEERRHTDPLGLRETTDTTNDPYLPTVFVLHPDLTIAARYDGYWYWGRPGPEELRADLRAVTARIRPDFDPPRP
jgi:hypothetical protein